jgi:hypothetical protein
MLKFLRPGLVGLLTPPGRAGPEHDALREPNRELWTSLQQRTADTIATAFPSQKLDRPAGELAHVTRLHGSMNPRPIGGWAMSCSLVRPASRYATAWRIWPTSTACGGLQASGLSANLRRTGAI